MRRAKKPSVRVIGGPYPKDYFVSVDGRKVRGPFARKHDAQHAAEIIRRSFK